jgi:cyclopropane-fatty-acyl-phospholipid synthase
MVYSCAYFPRGDETIDQAQQAKLDLLCRKLRLAAGERLLDIGCGWGALVRHAVRWYGVRATGVTLSAAQARLATDRIRESGLADQCRVLLQDYRDLAAEAHRRFDKIVSVGMFEHVGRARLGQYFRTVFGMLRPGGLFLNHGIVAAPDRRGRFRALARRVLWGSGEFIGHYVFPDGELVRLEDVIAESERAGFETRDVESLREHYVLTLRHWVRRLEARIDEARRVMDEQRIRIWRLYMAGSAHAFASGRQGLAQVLLARPTADGVVRIPRTREDVYRPR